MKIKVTSVYVDDQNKACASIRRCWALPRRSILVRAHIAG